MRRLFAAGNPETETDDSEADSDFFPGLIPVFNTPVESEKSPAEDQSQTTSTIKVLHPPQTLNVNHLIY